MIKNPLLHPTRINLPTTFPVFSPAFPLSPRTIYCVITCIMRVFFLFRALCPFTRPVTLHKIHRTFLTGWIWLPDAQPVNDLKDENGTSFCACKGFFPSFLPISGLLSSWVENSLWWIICTTRTSSSVTTHCWLCRSSWSTIGMNTLVCLIWATSHSDVVMRKPVLV